MNSDTDQDGISDGLEVSTYKTDPQLSDTDSDGLIDLLEVSTYGTDPLVADTDRDGLDDGVEVTAYKTNPLAFDTDSDGLTDGIEVNTCKTNPLISDTDNDDLSDGLEVNGWSISVDGFQRDVTSNPLSLDSDEDTLNDYSEYAAYLTDPSTGDTDSDGLPDKWEVNMAFNPTNSYDALKDPDYDGLTNLQEYNLGTITKDGVLSHQKDLFVEIDYMSGYAPSTTAMNYFVTYFDELNIHVHVAIDDQISWSQLTDIGVSPDSLAPNECSLVEQTFHGAPTTHVYVFYAKALRDSDGDEPLGWASSGFGAFMNKEKINSQEGLSVLWLTDKIKAEKVVLLHEIGHTLNVISRNQQEEEDYCSSWGCIMAGADEWWDVFGGIANLIVLHSDSPRYCQDHAKQINLSDKWSVTENWIA